MSTARHSVELSGIELLTCWETLHLGPPPTLLALFSPAHTHTERAHKRTQAITDLTQRGLADGHLPHPTLADALRLIADPSHWLDLRCARSPHQMLFTLGAISGPHGAILSTTTGSGTDGTDADPYQLCTLDAAHVPTTMLALLGPLHPGVGNSVNIPADLLDRAGAEAPPGDLWAIADQLRGLGVPRNDATSMVHMVTGIRLGGQLGATTRTEHREHRAPWVIGFHATDHGWFSQTRRSTGPTGPTVTIAPTDTTRLLRHWTDLVTYLASRSAQRTLCW